MIYQFDEAMYCIEAFQHIVDNQNEYTVSFLLTKKYQLFPLHWKNQYRHSLIH